MADVVMMQCGRCKGLVEVHLDELNEGQKMLVDGQLVTAPPITATILAQVGVYHDACREAQQEKRSYAVLVEVTELVDGKARDLIGSFEVVFEPPDVGARFVDALPDLSEKVQDNWAKLAQSAALMDMPDQTAGVVIVEGETPPAPPPPRAMIHGHPITTEPQPAHSGLWTPEG